VSAFGSSFVYVSVGEPMAAAGAASFAHDTGVSSA
jgi:hypothetical protein